jgi:gluconolactonase
MMDWRFERVAGPLGSAAMGVVWDGSGVLFTHPESHRILRYDPQDGKVGDFRKWTNGAAGLAFAPNGELFGAQQLSRRIVRYNSEGSTMPMAYRFVGLPYHSSFHNMPKHLAIDAVGRIWFSDPAPRGVASGPPLPFPDHCSVLRLEQPPDRSWVLKRMTYDTTAPAGVALSRDGKTLYVAEDAANGATLRAYPINADGSLGEYDVLHHFGGNRHCKFRGIDGMTVDAEGNIVAAAGSTAAGPGALIYVFTPRGRVIETHPVPVEPTNCAFGDADLTSLYVTTIDGSLYRARDTGRRGKRN